MKKAAAKKKKSESSSDSDTAKTDVEQQYDSDGNELVDDEAWDDLDDLKSGSTTPVTSPRSKSGKSKAPSPFSPLAHNTPQSKFLSSSACYFAEQCNGDDEANTSAGSKRKKGTSAVKPLSSQEKKKKTAKLKKQVSDDIKNRLFYDHSNSTWNRDLVLQYAEAMEIEAAGKRTETIINAIAHALTHADQEQMDAWETMIAKKKRQKHDDDARASGANIPVL
jgi:hypothetical protein